MIAVEYATAEANAKYGSCSSNNTSAISTDASSSGTSLDGFKIIPLDDVKTNSDLIEKMRPISLLKGI